VGATTAQSVSHGLIPVEFDADAAGALPDPGGPDERGGASGWLYRMISLLPLESVTTGGSETLRIPLILNAMRKLHAGMVLNWIIDNPSGVSINFQVSGRAFILLS